MYQQLTHLSCQLSFNPISASIALPNKSSIGIISAQAVLVARTSISENATIGTLVHALVDPLRSSYPGNATYTIEPNQNPAEQQLFKVDPVLAGVSVSRALDHETSSAHAVRIKIHHDALYADESTSCARIAGIDWLAETKGQNKCRMNFPAHDLAAGGIACKKLRSLLAQVDTSCFHQDYGTFVLQRACTKHCAVDGLKCGRTTHQYCPRTPQLRQQAASVVGKDGADACSIGGLTQYAICVKPQALPCDGNAMSELRHEIKNGNASCTALDNFYRTTSRCVGDMRIDQPLFDAARKNCTRCAGMCQSCKSTDVDGVVESLRNAVKASAAPGCEQVGMLVKQIDACSNAIVGANTVMVLRAKLATLQKEMCNDFPLQGDFASMTFGELDRLADAATNGAHRCNATLLPMIDAISVCHNGLPKTPSMSNLLETCQNQCQSTCTRTVSHEIVLQIDLTNTNDNPPVFQREAYRFELGEDGTFVDGKVLGTVTAIDADNDLVTYSVAQYRTHTCEVAGQCSPPWDSTIDIWHLYSFKSQAQPWEPDFDGSDAPVDVGKLNGAIVQRQQYDVETFNIIEITVTAQDQNTAHVATSIVTIGINDANDNTPVLTVTGFGVVKENQPPGTPVTSTTNSNELVQASDSDMVDRNKLRFSIKENGDPDHVATAGGVPFEIDALSGNIVTTAFLNYEIRSEYELTVVVRDADGHTDQGKLSVRVTDVNEFGFFPPSDAETMYPTTSDPLTENPVDKLTYHVTINEGTAAPGDVCFKAAAGESMGYGSDATFGLVSATPKDLPFIIDASGWISIAANASFDREDQPRHTFDIFATTPSRRATATVHVSVAGRL